MFTHTNFLLDSVLLPHPTENDSFASINSNELCAYMNYVPKYLTTTTTTISKNCLSGRKNMLCFGPAELKVLHMCFDWFLFAFESRDLSQADKSIKRMFSFAN